MGDVDNPGGRLRAGQFITATVELPPPRHEVVVPAAARGRGRPRERRLRAARRRTSRCYTLRRVAVAWRSQKEVHVRTRAASRRRRPAGCSRCSPASGWSPAAAIQLQSALDDRPAAKAGGLQCEVRSSACSDRPVEPSLRSPLHLRYQTASMIRKMIHWAVNQPLIVLLLALALLAARRLRVPPHQRRGLSRPGPADHRGRSPRTPAPRPRRWSAW